MCDWRHTNYTPIIYKYNGHKKFVRILFFSVSASYGLQHFTVFFFGVKFLPSRPAPQFVLGVIPFLLRSTLSFGFSWKPWRLPSFLFRGTQSSMIWYVIHNSRRPLSTSVIQASLDFLCGNRWRRFDWSISLGSFVICDHRRYGFWWNDHRWNHSSITSYGWFPWSFLTICMIPWLYFIFTFLL